MPDRLFVCPNLVDHRPHALKHLETIQVIHLCNCRVIDHARGRRGGSHVSSVGPRQPGLGRCLEFGNT